MVRVILLSLLLLGCSSHTIEKKRVYATYFDVSNIDFHGKTLILAKINNKFYYLRRDGKAMPVYVNQKGKIDSFKEGLARTKINGKIGFFNKNLDMVIEPFYDFAFPFHNGIAEICVGCREKREDNSILLDGGEWKRINREGIIVEE